MSGGVMDKRGLQIKDVEHLQQALGLITAYDLGVQERDFEVLGEFLKDVDNPGRTIHALVQISWLFLRSMEERGVDREDVMTWFGHQFATALEEMTEDT